ncbi:two component system sensor histidine kinase [gut metagenome]|uniref:histidine kinase n=1 Tax=gut metagenome TaxID=749906 RepID=J9GIX8_9ZZZZ
MGACRDTAGSREVCLIDSLNEWAYALRYKNLTVSGAAAAEAYAKAQSYASGRAEACNQLGFAAFLTMDFKEAERLYKEVYACTESELELLIADVGMMRICQRKAMNKEFYDYRNRALRRLKRIAEEPHLSINAHERKRLKYAQSEFYLVSAVYYYYLQQQEDAMNCIRQADEQMKLEGDTAQLLYFHYLKGAAGLCQAASADDMKLKRFDELYAVWRIASLKGYVYFEGNGLQGLADLMVLPADYDFFKKYRNHAILQLELPIDSLLPLRMSQQALHTLCQFQDPYQIAGSYVSIGKYLNLHGRYSEALDTLTQALDKVNQIYGTAPECISRICEQLSVSYAGLGQKVESDVHRNWYLDILDDTRQDKELESRYQALEQEAMQLNGLLVAVMLGLVGIGVFFGLFSRWSKVRSLKHVERLQGMLKVCQLIISAIPADAQSEEDIITSIELAVRQPMQELLGNYDLHIENGRLVIDKKLNKEEQAMLRVLNPYVQWALDTGRASVSLNDERKRLERQKFVYEMHIASNKRRNIEKKTCLAIANGIQPYMDRMAHVVHKLTHSKDEQTENFKIGVYQYLDELVSKINEYNEILTLWIKMKQGSLSMNIETFNLNELFDLLRKGSRSFELRNQTFQVAPAEVTVKADKALTMFMLNTLADNARKYTPQGGRISIFARTEKNYVEISVEDTGCGLSESDVRHLNDDKVYDSSKIGLDTVVHREEWQQKKGSGFGLMNCKGIIEKYRKTNDLFKVCLFGVESKIGKGSRFFFRLPVGVRKSILFYALLAASVVPADAQLIQSETEVEPAFYEQLLDSASDYANEAYYANVEGRYECALQYIDSAMWCLNRHYWQFGTHSKRTMKLYDSVESPAEMDWWKEPFNSDFHVILDIRNEAAVAFLALKQWQAYSYNNAAYTALYKLLGEDQSLESYCRQLERSSSNKRVGMILGVVLLAVFLFGYYILYIRKRLQNRWNLEQVLHINRNVFKAVLPIGTVQVDRQHDEDYGLQRISQNMVNAAFEEMDDLLGIDDLGMAIYNEAAAKLEFAFYRSDDDAGKLLAQSLMQRCFMDNHYLEEKNVLIFPLHMDAGGQNHPIGVFYVKRTDDVGQETDILLVELIANYVAAVTYNAVVKLAAQYQDIETAEDETNKASWEDNMLHVQNLVLDNCLSTIKHETVYYPHKIKQLIGKLRQHGLAPDEEKDMSVAIEELIVYYKGIFTILSQCASRQLEEITFRRSVIDIAELMHHVEKYFKKMSRNCSASISLELKPLQGMVCGDKNLLQFLLECLVDEALVCQ